MTEKTIEERKDAILAKIAEIKAGSKEYDELVASLSEVYENADT